MIKRYIQEKLDTLYLRLNGYTTTLDTMQDINDYFGILAEQQFFPFLFLTK
jgi:hypothetical protein